MTTKPDGDQGSIQCKRQAVRRQQEHGLGGDSSRVPSSAALEWYRNGPRELLLAEVITEQPLQLSVQKANRLCLERLYWQICRGGLGRAQSQRAPSQGTCRLCSTKYLGQK